MRTIQFVIGGEKSGKSLFALKLGEAIGGERAYVATATPVDEEMEKRIKRHKLDRGPSWITFEESVKVGELIENIGGKFDVILIDCLTIWVSNLIYHRLNVEAELKRLILALERKESNFIVVSNEVGMGIVPENPLGREFRTLMGEVNQSFAKISDTVYLMVAGIPLKIKGNLGGESS